MLINIQIVVQHKLPYGNLLVRLHWWFMKHHRVNVPPYCNLPEVMLSHWVTNLHLKWYLLGGWTKGAPGEILLYFPDIPGAMMSDLTYPMDSGIDHPVIAEPTQEIIVLPNPMSGFTF